MSKVRFFEASLEKIDGRGIVEVVAVMLKVVGLKPSWAIDIIILPIKLPDADGGCFFETKGGSKKCVIFLPKNTVIKGKYQYEVIAHEIGHIHAYANDIEFKNDESEEAYADFVASVIMERMELE